MSCEAWPIVVDPTCCPEWPDFPAAVQQRAIALATETIWALSGRQFGICTACVRPCKAFCFSCGTGCMRPGQWGQIPGWGRPYVNGAGQWTSCGCGCGAGSSCKAACAVYLDPAPVNEIVSVKINGAAVPGGFMVLDGNILVRAAGAGCWPECNDLASADTAAGTWSVTYTYGIKPTATALYMAAIFACEAAKLCAGLKCRLSGPITQVTRDGVSITLDPKQFIDAGLTSIPEIDRWLRAINPYGLAQRGEIWSPDTQPLRQVTWPSNVC
jgi:hypothetical protein